MFHTFYLRCTFYLRHRNVLGMLQVPPSSFNAFSFSSTAGTAANLSCAFCWSTSMAACRSPVCLNLHTSGMTPTWTTAPRALTAAAERRCCWLWRAATRPSSRCYWGGRTTESATSKLPQLGSLPLRRGRAAPPLRLLYLALTAGCDLEGVAAGDVASEAGTSVLMAPGDGGSEGGCVALPGALPQPCGGSEAGCAALTKAMRRQLTTEGGLSISELAMFSSFLVKIAGITLSESVLLR